MLPRSCVQRAGEAWRGPLGWLGLVRCAALLMTHQLLICLWLLLMTHHGWVLLLSHARQLLLRQRPLLLLMTHPWLLLLLLLLTQG